LSVEALYLIRSGDIPLAVDVVGIEVVEAVDWAYEGQCVVLLHGSEVWGWLTLCSVAAVVGGSWVAVFTGRVGVRFYNRHIEVG
jgi:hypothetical protein